MTFDADSIWIPGICSSDHLKHWPIIQSIWKLVKGSWNLKAIPLDAFQSLVKYLRSFRVSTDSRTYRCRVAVTIPAVVNIDL